MQKFIGLQIFGVLDFGGGRVILEFSHIFYAFLGVLTVTDIFVR